MFDRPLTFVPQGKCFSHADAARIFGLARRDHFSHPVIIDLNRAEDATTSAFAQLVLLRRSLLRRGRDLRLIGLHQRAAGLFEVNRLTDVLPVA